MLRTGEYSLLFYCCLAPFTLTSDGDGDGDDGSDGRVDSDEPIVGYKKKAVGKRLLFYLRCGSGAV